MPTRDRRLWVHGLVEEAGAKSVAFARTELEALGAALRQIPDIIVSDVNLLSGTGPDAVTGNPEALQDYDHDGVMEKPLIATELKQEIARLTIRR